MNPETVGGNIYKEEELSGSMLKLIECNSQSYCGEYAQYAYANSLILRDRISVLFAKLASSSREAVRPISEKLEMLYFNIFILVCHV